jgi:hypothetical protein
MYNPNLPDNQFPPQACLNVNNDEMNRLLAAAISSTGFRELLINNPEIAIANGYQGEKFYLNADEYRWILSVQATDLKSFASQLLEYQNTRSNLVSDLPVALHFPTMSFVSYSNRPKNDRLFD